MINLDTSKYSSSQNWILSVGAERLPGLRLFYFEGASLDARDNGQLSEDFVSYNYEKSCLYFVVCDGVQQSIDASLAARLLGIRLLDVLPRALGNKKIIESLVKKERPLIDNKIFSTPIDENDPVYEFHVRARNEIGAQVKFACGTIDFMRGVVELYWAGDIRLIVYGKKSEILFSWEEDNNQFWSTRGAYSLDLSTRSWKIKDISQLSITSDGIRENFKEILDKKILLNDVRLINHRYEIGVDDISGVDIKFVPTDNIKQLSNLRSVSLINNSSLFWTQVSHAEKYRIYHISDNSIQHIAEVDSKQKSYSFPDNLGNGTFYVQAISSQAISSNLSEPVHYIHIPDQIPEPYHVEPIQMPEPKFEPVKPAPALQPNRLWQRIAVGCGIFGLISLIVGAIGFASIKSLLTPSSTGLIVESPTYSTTTPVVIATITPFTSATPFISSSSFTPEITLADITLTPSETPSLTATIDNNLDECQRKTVIDEPGRWMSYQVQPGDSFYRLSQIYNISVEELMRINCYQNSNLAAGKYILIPVTN